MNRQYDPLFTPWKIGTCEIKNRIVMTSMGGTNLLGWMEKNHFDKAGADFIQTVAENNAGLVLPGIVLFQHAHHRRDALVGSLIRAEIVSAAHAHPRLSFRGRIQPCFDYSPFARILQLGM